MLEDPNVPGQLKSGSGSLRVFGVLWKQADNYSALVLLNELLLCLAFETDWVLQHTPGCPRTQSVTQAGFKLTVTPSLSTS